MIEINHILEAENFINDIDVVIFDLDDTLYPEKQYVKSGYKKIAEYFEKPEMTNDLWTAFENKQPAIDVVLEKYGLLDKKEEALKIYRNQMPDIRLYDGVLDMINRIKEKKRIGIITDGRPEGQRAKIEALKLEGIKCIITDEIGGVETRKPNPKAFEMMQEYFKVPFDKMVYIGDNIKKDFIAPEKLKMKSIWVRNPDGLYFDKNKNENT